MITPDGEVNLEVPDNVFPNLTFSCRTGSYFSCAGKIVSGELDQSDCFLDDDQSTRPRLGTCWHACAAFPKSNLILETDMDEEINASFVKCNWPTSYIFRAWKVLEGVILKRSWIWILYVINNFFFQSKVTGDGLLCIDLYWKKCIASFVSQNWNERLRLVILQVFFSFWWNWG